MYKKPKFRLFDLMTPRPLRKLTWTVYASLHKEKTPPYLHDSVQNLLIHGIREVLVYQSVL